MQLQQQKIGETMSSRSEILKAVRTSFTEQRRKAWGTHPGLWLDKYIESQSRDEKTSRPSLVKEVTATPISEAYTAYFKSWEKMLKEYSTFTRKAKVQGRMVVGLGSESVLETSIALHRTYGVPYIPGSALKGLAASYARSHLDEDWKPTSDAYKIVFGDTGDAGYIIFFDALYIPDTGHHGQVLYPDVITVHHQNYYNGTDAPTDMDSPNPVPFLSATGTYLVALAAPDITDAKGKKAWVNAAFTLLQNALKTMGIGAKTSSGYGRLELEGGPVEVPYVRPSIPSFQVNQPISGSVLAPSNELQQKVPEAKAYLRFREFSSKIVLIVVGDEEATTWTPGQTKNCIFLREEEREGCTILFCVPDSSKKKSKNKNKK
jgi:CRISPR-associated protein Cmr6